MSGSHAPHKRATPRPPTPVLAQLRAERDRPRCELCERPQPHARTTEPLCRACDLVLAREQRHAGAS